jgi:hypothetical protein
MRGQALFNLCGGMSRQASFLSLGWTLVNSLFSRMMELLQSIVCLERSVMADDLCICAFPYASSIVHNRTYTAQFSPPQVIVHQIRKGTHMALFRFEWLH